MSTTTEVINGRDVRIRHGRRGADTYILAHGAKASADTIMKQLPIAELDASVTVAALQGTADRPWLPDWLPDLWIGRHFNAGRQIQGEAGARNVDDVYHLQSVVDELSYRFDPARIVLCGFSNGGHLALRYAALRLNHDPRLRVATWGSVLTEVPEPGVRYRGPVRVTMYHGLDDKLIQPVGTVRVNGKRLLSRGDTAAHFGEAGQSSLVAGGHEVPADGAAKVLAWVDGGG